MNECRFGLFRRKTFSVKCFYHLRVFVCCKIKVNGNYLFFPGKSFRKIRKTVYEIYFRKPFSKTRVRLLPTHFTSLSALSFFLTVIALFSLSLLSSHCHCSLSHCLNSCPATPSHPQPHRPMFSLCLLSLLPNSCSASSSHSQPPHRTVSPMAQQKPTLLRSASPMVNPHPLRSLSLTDQI